MVFKGTGDGKKMKKLMAIGEVLIDFIPEETGKPMKDVCGFKIVTAFIKLLCKENLRNRMLK